MDTEPKIKAEDLEAINELAMDARGVDDLVTIREMAAEDYGDGKTTIRVENPDGTIVEHDVTEVGRDKYAKATEALVRTAVKSVQTGEASAVENWTVPKQ